MTEEISQDITDAAFVLIATIRNAQHTVGMRSSRGSLSVDVILKNGTTEAWKITIEKVRRDDGSDE